MCVVRPYRCRRSAAHFMVVGTPNADALGYVDIAAPRRRRPAGSVSIGVRSSFRTQRFEVRSDLSTLNRARAAVVSGSLASKSKALAAHFCLLLSALCLLPSAFTSRVGKPPPEVPPK